MKKYNRLNRNTFLGGIILPFLVFFISINVTYAYLTATTSKYSALSTALIKISLSNFNASGFTSVSSDEETIDYIYPGDTLTINGTLINSGSSPCYAIIEFTLDVTKVNQSQAETHAKQYFTFTMNQNGTYSQAEITKNQNNFSINAGIILKNETRDFTITYVFDGIVYNNDYKLASATYKIRAQAMQMSSVTDPNDETAKTATTILMNNFE